MNPLAGDTGRCEVIGPATLWLGDAYRIAPTLGRFDLLCTDPPYEFDTAGGGRFRKDRPQLDQIRAQGLDQGVDPAIFNPLLYDAIISFCHANQLAQLTAHIAGNWRRIALCTWRKTNPLPVANNHYRPDTEIWLHGWNTGFAPQGTLEEKARWWDGPSPRGADRHGHPTPKPLPLMEKIIANGAGDTVLDPFMGTGTTGVAAIRAGRRFTGIEANPAHFDTARRRIAEAVASMEPHYA